MPRMAGNVGFLGDTPRRDYSRKLRLFNAFAKPEIRHAISTLGLAPGMRVLDAGCGTGEALEWLQDAVEPAGSVGIELAAAHADIARARLPWRTEIIQGDLLNAPLTPASFDLVWSVNTINHLRDPHAGVSKLASLLRAGGRLALGQSALLPEMFFAWDSMLERFVNEAVRAYYRERYGIVERELAAVRSIVGVLRQAQLRNVTVRTVAIERISPVDPATEAYLLEAIFRDTWGERLRPYLSAQDFAHLAALCDPNSPQFALRRPDFHFLQTLTLAVGEI
jgi:SAM-dependent methyltransferase